jgi:hypothetical protein
MPEIRIDTSNLSATTFRVEGLNAATFDGNNGVTVSLPAGEYQFALQHPFRMLIHSSELVGSQEQ